MADELQSSAQRVQDALKAQGFTCQVVEMPASTRTAQEAADAIGCSVEQIVKSLVFKGKESHKPIFVVASGGNRVHEKRLGKQIGEPIEKADADFVRQHTGFAIGGVAPIGLATAIATFIDEDLLQYETIWAAAGTPNTVFQLTPGDLQHMTTGRVIPVK